MCQLTCNICVEKELSLSLRKHYTYKSRPWKRFKTLLGSFVSCTNQMILLFQDFWEMFILLSFFLVIQWNPADSNLVNPNPTPLTWTIPKIYWTKLHCSAHKREQANQCFFRRRFPLFSVVKSFIDQLKRSLWQAVCRPPCESSQCALRTQAADFLRLISY